MLREAAGTAGGPPLVPAYDSNTRPDYGVNMTPARARAIN